MNFEDALNRYLAPLRRAISRLAVKGVIWAVNDDPAIQTVSITGMAGEGNVQVEHLQPYGLSAHPIPAGGGDRKGPLALVLSVAGAPDHRVAIIIDDERHRPTGLQQGEVILYDDQGQAVHLGRTTINITSPHHAEINAPTTDVNTGTATVNASTKAVLNAPLVELGGEGGPAVARVGDNVRVGTGSSAGDWPIIEGSSKVKAAD